MLCDVKLSVPKERAAANVLEADDAGAEPEYEAMEVCGVSP
jgi:hypothetical protein